MNGNLSTSSSERRGSRDKRALSNLKIYYDKLLGTGSFSKVFPGKYKGNLVAVKIMSTKHLEDKIVKQLKRELQIIKILQKNPHPNIATYYKIIYDKDKMIIVMELCSGGELSKQIKKHLDIETIKNYFSQILDGYKHLLELNIVHRDIKSANLLLSEDKKTVKFIDFGLSKIFTVDLNKTVCGSPLYMAPELLLNHDRYNSKSDIWSLGVLLYEMVYGKTPFHHCKQIKVLKEMVRENSINYPKKQRDDEFAETVPDDLIRYMKRLLELDPTQRIEWEQLAHSEWLSASSDSKEEHTEKKTIKQRRISTAEELFAMEIDGMRHNHQETRSIMESLTGSADVDNAFFSISNTSDLYDTITSADTIDALEDTDTMIPHLLGVEVENHGKDTGDRSRYQKDGEKRSAPIPIRSDQRTRYQDMHFNGTASPDLYSRYGSTYPASYREIDLVPRIPMGKAESFGNPNPLHAPTLEDISMLENYFDEEYEMLLEQQKTKATESGLIDINDVDDMLIAKVPEKTTANEYISKNSLYIGTFLYSRSAPVASSFAHGIGKVAKTVGKIGDMMSPPN